MKRPIESNLTGGKAAVNLVVICVAAPDMSCWKKGDDDDPSIEVPQLNKKYKIRANVYGQHGRGILLAEIRNKKAVIGDELTEPFFPHSAFYVPGG